MNIKFQNRPSINIVEYYCKKIEKYLSAHDISVKIELHDIPAHMENSLNGKLYEIKNLWIGKIIINCQAVKDFVVRVHRLGIEENIEDREIWRDAWLIQKQIYSYLGFVPNISEPNGAYWRLWDHLLTK